MKKKMNKFFRFSLLSIFVLSLLSPSFTASASDNKDVKEVKLKVTSVKISDFNNVNIERTETKDLVTLKVFKKQTGELTDVYTEKAEPEVHKGITGLVEPTAYSIVTRTRDVKSGPVTSRLMLKLRTYNSGSFTQINEVLDKSFYVITSGPTMQNANVSVISTTGKYPTSGVTSNASGTIEYKGTAGASGELSVDILKSAGFTISGSTSTEWVARLYVSTGLTVNTAS